MAARSLWAVRRRVQHLLASSAASDARGCPHPFSTATQSTAGEDCGSEDPTDELGPSLAERALKLKAVRLEKEVQDLTEFRVSVRTWWRWRTSWRRPQSAFLKKQSLGTRSSRWRRSSEACHF
ncbi:GrpE like 2, mitochondrial [Phyllostomus discolor]|uniref:GrpE like 2, mitochondrial n=1 Tax=Phyllostomus discolor TaxID=89673 RepID=A0A833YY77_9CHIR|nr:GrpE like 2, mitochondrial [Phyllostomus discolor]